MSRYAIIQNGIVINVIEYETDPGNPPPGFDDTHTAVQSDIASPNDTYANGVFTLPQPYPSWTLVNNVWTPPTPMPTINGPHMWDESTKNWVK
jgi:hypothetical protein